LERVYRGRKINVRRRMTRVTNWWRSRWRMIQDRWRMSRNVCWRVVGKCWTNGWGVRTQWWRL